MRVNTIFMTFDPICSNPFSPGSFMPYQFLVNAQTCAHGLGHFFQRAERLVGVEPFQPADASLSRADGYGLVRLRHAALLPQLDDLEHQFDALVCCFIGGPEFWILQLTLQVVAQVGMRLIMGCRRAAAVRSIHIHFRRNEH
jgi:hypothetical protein